MATINSQDDLITALGAETTVISPHNKNAITIEALGTWYCMAQAAGSPPADPLLGSGNNLTFMALTSTGGSSAATAAAGGSITTTTFTDTNHGSGRFTIGQVLTGTSIAAGTYITAYGTGTGSNAGGTYTINQSNTLTSSQAITGHAVASYIPDGGVVGSTNPKYLLNASVMSAAASCAPAVFQLVDMLGFYPISTVTTSGAQALSTATLPRYADGIGVQAFIVALTTMGAGTPTVQLKYINPAASSGRLTPSAPSLPIINAAATMGQIMHSGTGAGKYGPFLPLQAGDNGILMPETINFNATMTSGACALVLCKPIGLPLPITTAGVPAERDYFNQLPSLPRIYDGACPAWLKYSAATSTPANTPYYPALQTVWKAA